jgi:predicted kinase
MTPNTDNWTPWSVDKGSLAAIPPVNDNRQLARLGAAIGKEMPGTFAGRSYEMQLPYGEYTSTSNNLPDVVAFTGVAGSGKSTAAGYLVEKRGYTRVRFAGPLKAAMAAMGFSHAEIEGELKETPNDALGGKTPRYAMQTLGTEWGRNCIVDDFWIRLWRRDVDAVLADGGRVVVDDCRFPNEAQAIRKLGGDIFKIEGRGGIAGGHVSERGCGDEDLVIANDNTRDELFDKIEEALRRYE